MLLQTSSEETVKTKFEEEPFHIWWRLLWLLIDSFAIGSLRTCVSQYFYVPFRGEVPNYNGRPSVWFRFVEDTFAQSDSKNIALQFLQYFNSCHLNIKFTIGFEENNVIHRQPKLSLRKWWICSLGWTIFSIRLDNRVEITLIHWFKSRVIKFSHLILVLYLLFLKVFTPSFRFFELHFASKVSPSIKKERLETRHVPSHRSLNKMLPCHKAAA